MSISEYWKVLGLRGEKDRHLLFLAAFFKLKSVKVDGENGSNKRIQEVTEALLVLTDPLFVRNFSKFSFIFRKKKFDLDSLVRKNKSKSKDLTIHDVLSMRLVKYSYLRYLIIGLTLNVLIASIDLVMLILTQSGGVFSGNLRLYLAGILIIPIFILRYLFVPGSIALSVGFVTLVVLDFFLLKRKFRVQEPG